MGWRMFPSWRKKDLAHKYPGHIVEEYLGRGISLGRKYRPLYDCARASKGKAKPKFEKKHFKCMPADFVTTEDGTGIVHTAVMYGKDDSKLGNKIGLPKVHLVNPEGKIYCRDRDIFLRTTP